MFFALSKLVAIFIGPFFWLVIFFLLAWIKKSRRWLRLGILSTLFFSNHFIADEACRAWELSTPPSALAKPYDYAIVLGGMSSYQPGYQRLQFNESADRLWQALLLQKRGVVDSLIITGGSGKWDKPEETEAAFLKLYLEDLMPKNKKVLYEWESRNTAQNAENTLNKFPQIQGKRLLIITSGFHARRALACFAQAGLQADLYTVDMMGGERKYSLDHLLIPSVTPIKKWTYLIKEWVGCLAYKASGKIN